MKTSVLLFSLIWAAPQALAEPLSRGQIEQFLNDYVICIGGPEPCLMYRRAVPDGSGTLTMMTAVHDRSLLGEAPSGAIIVVEEARWRGDTFCLPQGDDAIVGVFEERDEDNITFDPANAVPTSPAMERFIRERAWPADLNFADYCYGFEVDADAPSGIAYYRNGIEINPEVWRPIPVSDLPLELRTQLY